MKRKLIIFILALATFLPAFSGLASLLGTRPDLTETTPITIAGAGPDIKAPAPPPPPPSPDGASWGG